MEHAARVLPAMIKQALDVLLRSSRGHVSPSAVSGVLTDCIVKFDRSITTDFTRMFPGGPDGLQRMSSAQIRRIFQDRASGSQNMAAATRCLQGTTALITITDPTKQNIWIANLGDCQAGTRTDDDSFVDLASRPIFLIVLGTRSHTGDWTATFATTLHNGDNPSELHRIRSQHPPGERECVEDNRVVGFLSPTRCEHHRVTSGTSWGHILKFDACASSW